jgi:hypothetical protein
MFTREQQRSNLETLGRYLLRLTKQHNVSHFRMGTFVSHWNDDAREMFQVDNVKRVDEIIKECFCDTSACAIGHIPLVFKKEWDKWIKTYAGRLDDWSFICEAFLGIEAGSFYNFDFHFMFGGQWEESNDPYYRTSWAVADRIAWYLDGKWNFSDMYHDQMDACVGYAAKIGWISKSAHRTRVAWAKQIDGMMLKDVHFASKLLAQDKKEREHASSIA